MVGYVSKGVYEEVQTAREPEQNNDASEAHMMQGFKEWDQASEEERRNILVGIKRQLEDLETLAG